MSLSEIQLTEPDARSSIHHGIKQFGFPQANGSSGGCVASCITSGATQCNSVLTTKTLHDAFLTRHRRNHDAFLTTILAQLASRTRRLTSYIFGILLKGNRSRMLIRRPDFA